MCACLWYKYVCIRLDFSYGLHLTTKIQLIVYIRYLVFLENHMDI